MFHYNNSFFATGALQPTSFPRARARQQWFLRASRVKTGVVAPGRVEGLLHEATSPSLGKVSRRPTGGYPTGYSAAAQATGGARSQPDVGQPRARSFLGSKRPTAASTNWEGDLQLPTSPTLVSVWRIHGRLFWFSSWVLLFTRPFGQTVDKRHVRKREVPGNERGSCRARCGTADATKRGSWYARFLSRSMLMFFHATIYSRKGARLAGGIIGSAPLSLIEGGRN